MTSSEEREYLIDLLFEGTRWKVDKDEVLNGLELEIRDRLRRLSGVNTIDEDGLCQSELPDNLPAEEEKLTGTENTESVDRPSNRWKKQIKWRADKVRVFIDGKHVWKPREECVKQPRDNSKGGPKWTWKWIGPQDKKAQEEEAMWAEHENYNKEN